MNAQEVLEKVLKSYTTYYDVKREDVTPPFAAEAEFHSHDKQYFLVRSATLGESESNEYVYFHAMEELDLDTLQKLDEAAWEAGMARVTPHKDHRNSDVTLIVIADHITPEAASAAKKLKHYKSYQFTTQGWSHYRLVALETSTNSLTFNRQGQELKKLFRNILKTLQETCKGERNQ